jgi:hypothetical protein
MILAILTPTHIGGEKIKALAGGLEGQEIGVSESTNGT